MAEHLQTVLYSYEAKPDVDDSEGQADADTAAPRAVNVDTVCCSIMSAPRL